MQLLNIAISPPHFKYKDLALLAPLLKEGDYMTTINLKDGFFHVPVLPSHQPLMSFQWEGKTYVFQVLPSGMSASPWLFTCFVQATVHHLRRQGRSLAGRMATSPKGQAGTVLSHYPQLQSWTSRTGTTVCPHGTAAWQTCGRAMFYLTQTPPSLAGEHPWG